MSINSVIDNLVSGQCISNFSKMDDNEKAEVLIKTVALTALTTLALSFVSLGLACCVGILTAAYCFSHLTLDPVNEIVDKTKSFFARIFS